MEQLASPYPQSKIMQRDKETGEEKRKEEKLEEMGHSATQLKASMNHN